MIIIIIIIIEYSPLSKNKLGFVDRKFNTDTNPNWHPDQVGQTAQRSTNWEDGLGHRDVAKNRQDKQRLERKRDASERYHSRIQEQAAEKEQKESAQHQQHRLAGTFPGEGWGYSPKIWVGCAARFSKP